MDIGGVLAEQTSDGGYIVCGTTGESKEEGNLLIKTDADGNEVWFKTFVDRYVRWVQQTTDGGYILCGRTHYSRNVDPGVWMMKTDTEGNAVWEKIFGVKSNDGGTCIRQTADGGYILCGGQRSLVDGRDQIRLIKTDTEGNKQWDKLYRSDKKDNTSGEVQQTADGGYVLCGSITYSTQTRFKAWTRLIKTDAEGNTLWDQTFGNGELQCYAVSQTTDSGYIICGDSSAFLGPIQALLLKTDDKGNELWKKDFGGGGVAFGYSAQQCTDGGYVMSGIKYKHLGSGTSNRVIKTDANGNALWIGDFGKYTWSAGTSIRQTTDGGYIVCGTTSSEIDTGHSIELLKLAPDK
jgi:hypothetical protein